MGKSIWSSSASRSRKSSSTSWTTSSMRASGRSTLLTTSTTGQAGLERLAQHEAGLGERALGGVDQEEDAVDHGQAPLDLAAEVGVAGGVDDVDLHAAVEHGGVLGQDGDALLPLEVAGVHDPLGDLLVVPEGARTASSMASTRVVLPWSTWATMATLRMSSRVCRGIGGEGYPLEVAPRRRGGRSRRVRTAGRARPRTASSGRGLRGRCRPSSPTG